MDLKSYLKQRIEQIKQAVEMLPDNAFLKGELLAFESIFKKLEEEK